MTVLLVLGAFIGGYAARPWVERQLAKWFKPDA